MNPYDGRDPAYTLAQHVLGLRNPDGTQIVDEHRANAMSGASLGSVKVDVHMQGMVRAITQSVWIDAASWASRIKAEIEAQTAAVDIDGEIKRCVAVAVREAQDGMHHKIREAVEVMTSEAIRAYVGELPEMYAKQFANKVWTEAYRKMDWDVSDEGGGG